MNKKEFEIAVGRKTLLYNEKRCFRKLEQIFGAYVFEVIKLFPDIILDFGIEKIHLNLYDFTVNGGNIGLFKGFVDTYQNEIRDAVVEVLSAGFADYAGKSTRHDIREIPVIVIHMEEVFRRRASE